MSGRPYLNGSPAGSNRERAVRKTITLSKEMADYLTQLGGGNLSAGVREAARITKQQEESRP